MKKFKGIALPKMNTASIRRPSSSTSVKPIKLKTRALPKGGGCNGGC